MKQTKDFRKSWEVLNPGLVSLVVSHLGLLFVTSTYAGNGIHINANANEQCVSVNDPQYDFAGGGTTPNYINAEIQFKDAASGKCNSGTKASQKDSVLFYRPQGVTGVGATSLTLGGELFVNGGLLKLGDATVGQRIGDELTTASNGGFAIGNGASANGDSSLALGFRAKATGEFAFAGGNSAEAATPYALAFGPAAKATGARATAVGPSSIASGDSAIAFGRFAQSLGTNTTAIGRDTVVAATANEGVALGYQANVQHSFGVSLGSGSRTSATRAAAPVTLNGRTYVFDSSNLQGVVSVGGPTRTRQIINVAPAFIAANSFDAVNGAQLFAAYESINEISKTVNAQQLAINEIRDNKGSASANQAPDGIASVAQAIGGGASVGPDGKIVMPVIALSSIGEGPSQPNTLIGSIVAVDQTVQQLDAALGDTFALASATEEKAKISATQLQGLAPGETVASRIDAVKNNSLPWDPASNTYTASHGSTPQNRISNLAPGQNSTDAVNKSQLDTVGLAAGSAQKAADTANAKLAGIGNGETVIDHINQTVKSGNNTTAKSIADALGGGVTVDPDGKLTSPTYTVSKIDQAGVVAAEGQLSNNVGTALSAVDANVIKVNERVQGQEGELKKLTQDLNGLSENSLLWDEDSKTFNARHGGTSPNRITNVAAGQGVNDAVNKGQLDVVSQTAGTALTNAAGAKSVADSALATATGAQNAAETAQTTAALAQKAAENAETAATNAQSTAQGANAKLDGIGDGETVAGRIAEAAQSANQSLANALGGGAAVLADGSTQGPAYAVTSIGADGKVQPKGVPAANVGDALQTIDDSVAAVNANANRVSADVSNMHEQLSTGQLGLVQQNPTTRNITVANATDGTRITMEGGAGTRTLSGVKEGLIGEASTEVVVGSQLFQTNRDVQKNTSDVTALGALTEKQGVDLASVSDLVRSGNVGLTTHDPVSNTIAIATDRGGNAVNVAGKDGERKITGLAEGSISANSTDAVTGGQVNALTEKIKQLSSQGDGVAIDVKSDGSDRATVTPGSQAVAVGANAKASGANSVATGAGASAQAPGSTAIGSNANASAPGSVAIGDGAEAKRANTVSVGAPGTERQISNVAPATFDTDAVNLRQALNISRQEGNRTLTQANSYTDSRIGQLRRDTNAGIAAAMALASLPTASTPGKSMLALGTSYYAGQSAFAVGLSGRSGNGAWTYRASGTTSTYGEAGAVIGVGYEW